MAEFRNPIRSETRSDPLELVHEPCESIDNREGDWQCNDIHRFRAAHPCLHHVSYIMDWQVELGERARPAMDDDHEEATCTIKSETVRDVLGF